MFPFLNAPVLVHAEMEFSIIIDRLRFIEEQLKLINSMHKFENQHPYAKQPKDGAKHC